MQTMLVMVGYCLYKTVSFHSYTTDFGLQRSAYGYITNMPFVMAASAAVIGVSVILLLQLRSGRLRPHSI
ncbi:MAG: hypothetical protein IJC51_02505, partial [Eggerthellaceae bacterium]|nr:hypothetical protein [Eggerthellaceae bacterium]